MSRKLEFIIDELAEWARYDDLTAEAQQTQGAPLTLDQQAQTLGCLPPGRGSVRLLRVRCISTPAFDPGSPETPGQRWFKRKL